MKTNTNNLRSRAFGFAGLLLVWGVFFGLTSTEVFAQVPPANTTIGNQASATYTDAGGNTRSVTSNTVETVVQQVFALDLEADLTKNISIGGQVTFPHIVTNNGNGPDSFNITAVDVAATDDFDFGASNIVIYPDADLDGVPDNFTALTATPSIGAGESYGFVIVVTAPGTETTDGNEAQVTVTATSVGDSGQSDVNTDTAILSDGAVIDVQKSFSQSTAAAGDTITVTFRFSNNGNQAATNLRIQDPLPDSLKYVAGTGEWSGSSSALTDGNNGFEANGIDYQYFDNGNPFSADSVVSIIQNLGAGQSATIQFDVEVGSVSGARLNNTGRFKFDGGGGFVNTNTATVVVGDDFGVINTESALDVTTPNDSVIVASAAQGARVAFVNSYTNTGTTTDVYNLTLSAGTFPTGTTFQLLKSDGSGNALNPFTDTNNDGIPDTGPVAAGDSIQVILVANLPANATDAGPFEIAKTATSINDPSESATIFDKLGEITLNSVDLTNDDIVGGPAVLGDGIGAEATPVKTISTDPNNTINFQLFVNNTGGQADAYDISVFDTTANSFPSSWTITFKDPDNGNSVITNTGTIAAGANKEITAEIIIPAGQSPGDFAIFFQAVSPSSNASDRIHDQVTVNVDRNISLVKNQTGQIFPGGSRDYAHTLRIDSNVDENGPSGSSAPNSSLEISVSNSAANGFTAIVYWDRDASGTVTSGDSLLTSAGAGSPGALSGTGIGVLEFGDELPLVIKVTAGVGVQDGSTNTTTITVTDSNSGATGIAAVANTDITSVVAGLLVMEKSQSTDTTGYNNGAAAGGFVTSQLAASPGDVVFYEIEVTNNGAASVTGVDIVDTTPAYTVLSGSVRTIGSVTGTLSIDADPGDGNAGTIRVTATEIAPFESFKIVFAVQLRDS
ncbi:MAG: hypothetical protein AAFW89_00960 [Bacteroidota bacterium]